MTLLHFQARKYIYRLKCGFMLTCYYSHLLRKSGTFTALDFAPPRRFKDPEAMSDAGSVVSHNSGLSSKNAMALRNGAGRVSRLPGDQIFTQADSAQTLKPQWGMRP